MRSRLPFAKFKSSSLITLLRLQCIFPSNAFTSGFCFLATQNDLFIFFGFSHRTFLQSASAFDWWISDIFSTIIDFSLAARDEMVTDGFLIQSIDHVHIHAHLLICTFKLSFWTSSSILAACSVLSSVTQSFRNWTPRPPCRRYWWSDWRSCWLLKYIFTVLLPWHECSVIWSSVTLSSDQFLLKSVVMFA